MIACECNWYQDDVHLSVCPQSFDRVTRLRAQPCARANLRLPYEPVGVRVTEVCHDVLDRVRYLPWIRVPTVDNRHGKRVGAEQENNLGASFRRVVFERLGDAIRERLCVQEEEKRCK